MNPSNVYTHNISSSSTSSDRVIHGSRPYTSTEYNRPHNVPSGNIQCTSRSSDATMHHPNSSENRLPTSHRWFFSLEHLSQSPSIKDGMTTDEVR